MTELETVHIQKRLVSSYTQPWLDAYLPPDQPFDKYWSDPENSKQYEHRALVTRSQAVELLVEKDKLIKSILDHPIGSAEHFRAVCDARIALGYAE